MELAGKVKTLKLRNEQKKLKHRRGRGRRKAKSSRKRKNGKNATSGIRSADRGKKGPQKKNRREKGLEGIFS